MHRYEIPSPHDKELGSRDFPDPLRNGTLEVPLLVME